MPDFSKTVIYKIINYDYPDLIYVGSTTNFTKRKVKHKSETLKNIRTSKLYENIRSKGGWESWEMIKICDYPCLTSTEARQEEDRHMVEFNSTLNSSKAHLTDEQRRANVKEYYKNNADKIREARRQYIKDNTDKIKETRKQYEKDNADKIREKKKQHYLKQKALKLEKQVRTEAH